uniref:DOMON domain-containing protein n=1 Tax=Ciona savignyi TaxID=51511 RepID=H2ZCA5_CIOSA
HLSVTLLLSATALWCVGRCDIPPTEEYYKFTTLDIAGNVKLYWKYNDTHITLEVHGRTSGWVGIGFSPNGGMRDADIIFGWVRNGVAHISDRHGIGRTIPPADNQQDVNLLAGSECDGWTMLKFT